MRKVAGILCATQQRLFGQQSVLGGAACEMHRLLEPTSQNCISPAAITAFPGRLRTHQNLENLCRNRNGNVSDGIPRDFHFTKEKDRFVSLTLWRQKLLFFIFQTFELRFIVCMCVFVYSDFYRFSPTGLIPPHPGLSPHHLASHPAIVTPGPKQELSSSEQPTNHRYHSN